MARPKSTNTSNSKRKIRPALTPEAREQQLISLAIDLVEQRLIDGTASSQETTHFLKLATRKSQAETEKIELEKELVKAKTEMMQSAQKTDELYREALEAMRSYAGNGSSDDKEFYD